MPTRRLVFLFLFAALVTAAVPVVRPAAAAAAPPGAPGDAVGMSRPVARRPGPAYWLASADGGVAEFGRARFAGALAGTPLNSPVAAIAATPSGDGYWLVAGDGGVFAFGDARFHGAANGLNLTSRVVDLATTPSGDGYWLAATDGGVFAFGDAPYLGGLADLALRRPVTAIEATPTGLGYWVTAADGGVFAFGDAAWLGAATTGDSDASPVVDLTAIPSGRGYWTASADGGVRGFGEASEFGAAHAVAGAPVVGIVSTPSGHGYWVVDAEGGVFGYGDAGFYGSLADTGPRARVVGVAGGLGRAIPVEPRRAMAAGDFGWDISWPQCGGVYPGTGHRYAVVGVTDGRAYTVNPCLAEQHRWSLQHGSVGGLYVNVNYPPRRLDDGGLGLQFAHRCPLPDLGCQLRAWGEEGAAEAFSAAEAQGVAAPMWWLDVETTNRWSADPVANALVIAGATDALRARGVTVGIYSTPYQWGVIAGGYAPGLPTWVAGPRDLAGAADTCSRGVSFGGGPVWMVQFPYAGFDGNVMCPAGAGGGMAAFRAPDPPTVPQIGAADPRVL
jgi:hypothetical protein